MSYKITSRDYLERAKDCLSEDDVKYLFYAAFEIRCGVEARMQEYLEVQKHVSKKKKQGWQIAKLARNIEEAFRIGEKTAVIQMRNKNTNEIEMEVKYTPVKASLRKHAEQLGDYLHSAKKHYPAEHEYWSKFKSKLLVCVEELQYANSGRLLGPLLMHKKSNEVTAFIELPTPEEMKLINRYTPNSEVILVVSYE